MRTERDAYVVLQVDARAVGEVISAAYRALARQYHPDGPTPDPVRSAELNRAYDHVKTFDARRRYDEERARGIPVGPGPPQPYDPWGNPARDQMVGGDSAAVIDFGRYDGWRISEVARVDPDYLRWLSRHSTGIRYREAIARSLPGDVELGRRMSAGG